MSRLSPARDRALGFLQSLAAQRKPGERLATLSALASQAGVALVTMARAARVLREQGALTVAQRAGIRVARPMDTAGEPPPSAPEPAGGMRWQTVAAAIEHQVRTGRYRPGSVLPQSKELAAEHGVCPRTLRKALRRLTERKVLRYDRRRLAVPASGRLRSSACLALLTPGDAQGNLRLLTTRAHEYIRSLEAECSRRNVALLVITYDVTSGRLFREDALAAVADGRAAAPVLGALLLGGERCPVEVIERLAAGAKPLAVLDENGAVAAWPGFRRIPQARLFCVAFSPLAGVEVGRFLLDLGHRRVAYLSPMHSAAWSRARMAGLAQAVAAGEGAVSGFTRDAPADVTQAARLPAALVKRLAVVQRIRGLQDQVSLVLQRELIRPALLPLVEQALRRRDITAWVAANDSVALECMDLLRTRHVAVPGDVSVVGFDNSLPAFHQGLTSYAFNEAALMHAMVEHVLGSRLPRRPKACLPPVEIEGFVVARRSTSAPTPLLGKEM